MAEEAWLSGKLKGFSPLLMPAAHALTQAVVDLETSARGLSREELLSRPNGAPSVAFHLRHIAGSIDRLLTYSRGGELTEAQFDFLRNETAEDSDLSAAELTQKAVDAINVALAELKTVSAESLFEERFVGRKKTSDERFRSAFSHRRTYSTARRTDHHDGENRKE
jgi:hypothetical protein